MSAQGNGAVQAENVQASPLSKQPPSPASLLKDGDRVAFRVLENVSPSRYRILVRQQQVTVHSRIPLEAGGRYLAEVSIRQGVIHFLSRPIPANAIESLLAQRQILQTPLASLLRNLLASTPIPQSLLADCRTAEAVRGAFMNCGLFYEARVRQALRKGEAFSFVEDLKGFLLDQASKQPMASVRQAIATALKQMEVHQLLALQAGPEGPFSFWLPFGESMIIEGFVKRFRRDRDAQLLLTLRVPFLPGEELLVTLEWTSTRVDINFATGPSAYSVLRKAAHRLEDRLAELGIPRTTVRVSRGIPKRLKAELEGVRFVESYG
jgi:hypothetical protein